MPVTKQLIQIPFAGGLDTKTDPLQLPQGKLLDLQNAQFTKQGALHKRYGYDILTRTTEGGGSISAAKAISAFNDELVLFDGSSVYSFVDATERWINRGTAVSVIATDRQILRTNNTQQLNPDVAAHDGIEVYAWEDSTGGVRYTSLDSETGAFCVSNGLVNAGGVRPKCIAFADLIFIFYTDGANNILYKTVNPHNPSLLSAESNPIVDGFTGMSFDVLVSPDGTRLYLAYVANVGGAQINLLSFDSTMTAPSAATVEATHANAYNGGPSCMNLALDSVSSVWVSWGTGTEVRTAAFSLSLAPQLVSTQVENIAIKTVAGCQSATAGALDLLYETSSASRVKLSTVTKTPTVTAAGTLRSVGLASKTFRSGTQNYVNVAFQSTLQSTYFTVQVNSTFPIVAKISAGTGGGRRTNNTVSEVVSGLWANSIKGKLISEANVVFSLLGVNSTLLDFDNSNKFLSTTQSNNLLFVGGILQSYDGRSVTEHLFHVYPEGVTAVAAGSDGSLSTGTYQYVVTYEWTDNRGQIQRSAPSVATSVSVTATNHVTVTVPTLRLTAKSNVSIVIYRTDANGTLFRRVTSAVAPLQNDKTNDTVTFTDLAADTDIDGNELVYTTGGVLNNIAPPANKLITPYQNRVVVAGLEDPNLLWFSKNRFDNTNSNTIPVEFAAENTIGCDPRGGAITAIAALDDKLVIFKDSAIFVVAGDGPNDTGTGSAFPDPQIVASDAGCTNPNSVVLTPVGLMFKSGKGIYLLDRSLSVSYLGSPVEDFNDLTITSATLNKNANQIIFTTADGPALVYDYYFQQWGTWTNHQAEDSDTFGDVLCIVKSNGKVYKQNPSVFTDGGAPVFLSWTTPNMSLAGMSGYQRAFRAYILGSYKGPHSLDVSVAYDFNDAYTQFATIDSTAGVSVWGGDPTWGSSSPWGGEYKIFQFRIDFATQRCTAIRLKVSDNQSSSYNEGYSISNLALEVGAMPGGNRLPAAQIVGTR